MNNICLISLQGSNNVFLSGEEGGRKLEVLVTGSSGFLGSEMMKVLSANNNCRGLGGRFDFPVTSQEKVAEIIGDMKPQVIIHLAGYRDEKFCEENPREAFKVNALGTRNVAMAAARNGARLVYISTDLVFSGTKREGYYEFDFPKPNCAYGWTKYWGEHYIRNNLEEYYILRVPPLFGHNESARENILTPIWRMAARGEQIYVSPGRFTNPTWSIHVSEIVNFLIGTDNYGTYHVGSTGYASRYQFAAAVLEAGGLDTGLLHEATGKRQSLPPNNVIRSAILPYMVGVKSIPCWRDALKECLIHDTGLAG